MQLILIFCVNFYLIITADIIIIVALSRVQLVWRLGEENTTWPVGDAQMRVHCVWPDLVINLSK